MGNQRLDHLLSKEIGSAADLPREAKGETHQTLLFSQAPLSKRRRREPKGARSFRLRDFPKLALGAQNNFGRVGRNKKVPRGG